MNLINIFLQDEKLKNSKNKKQNKEYKQFSKFLSLSSIHFNPSNLEDYQITQKIKQKPQNDYPLKKLPKQIKSYISNSTQTFQENYHETMIPQEEIQQIQQQYQNILIFEQLQKKYQELSQISEESLNNQIKQQEIDIKILNLELEFLPKIDYKNVYESQQEELMDLQEQYQVTLQENEQLQIEKDNLQQKLKIKVKKVNNE